MKAISLVVPNVQQGVQQVLFVFERRKRGCFPLLPTVFDPSNSALCQTFRYACRLKDLP